MDDDQDGRVTGGTRSADALDEVQAAWARILPDLDLGVIGVVGRILRAARVITLASDTHLGGFGISRGEFDVLSSLRRSGGPRTPGSLGAELLISPAAITKRVRALTDRGLVSATRNASDGRSRLLEPTPAGRSLADRAMPSQLSFEEGMIAALSDAQRVALADALNVLLVAWEGPGGNPGALVLSDK